MNKPETPLDLLDKCWQPRGPLNPDWDEETKTVRYVDLKGDERVEPAESLDAWMSQMLR